MRTRVVAAGLTCAGILGACDTLTVVDCPAYVPPAIQVQVVDSLSGAWVAEGAEGFIAKGEVSLPLAIWAWEVVDGVPVATTLAPEGGSAGIYEVEIRRDGYRDWRMGGVVVTEGVCSVETVELVARLQPDPSSVS
jgi:hypothetical protein